jgi:hypothetical protein
MKHDRVKNGNTRLIVAIIVLGGLFLLGAVVLLNSSESPEGSEKTNTIETADKEGAERKLQGAQPRVVSTEQPAAEPSIADIKEEAVEEQRQRIMRNMADNLQNPGMNQIIVQQQRVLMADKYRDLVKALNLNSEETEYFIDLMTTRQMIHVDFGMKLMTGMLSPEEKEHLIQKLQKDVEPINEEIDYFINNDDDSEYLKYFEQTEQQRAAVNAMKSNAQMADMSIDDDTAEELIGIIYEEVNRHSFSVQLEENGEPDFSQFNDENINTLINEMNALAPDVVERAAEVLDPDQLALFEQAYLSYVAAEKNRLLMMQQLF